MSKGEKLFRFLAALMLDKFYGTVTIRFESGKVTHVETETRRMWQYRDLPDGGPFEGAPGERHAVGGEDDSIADTAREPN